MEFANKEYFLLLLLLIPYLFWYFKYRKKSEPTLRMSDTNAYRFAPKSWRMRLLNLPMLLRLLAFTLIVFALARPQTRNSWKERTTEGI
ncbi:MAG: BatA domain-containing protein, partial [Prevotella sp.]|nr:BatA domain-containing protein [Prevotella sp.]